MVLMYTRITEVISLLGNSIYFRGVNPGFQTGMITIFMAIYILVPRFSLHNQIRISREALNDIVFPKNRFEIDNEWL